MFGLFKKKEKQPQSARSQEQPREQSQEYKDFAADFLSEETDVLAITAFGPFDVRPLGGDGLYRVSIGVTDWKDEYSQELCRGTAALEAVADERLLEYLRAHVPRGFIVTATVRPSADGTRFLMTDLPKPGFDPELKAILEERKKPVTLEVEGLGRFTLNRGMGWFERTVDWLGSEVSLTFDQAEETQADAQATARVLMEEQAAWDERVRAFAADSLLDKANGLMDEEEPLTREDFLAQLALESILAGPGGAFAFWFGGDDLFLAHPVHVTGKLEEGPLQAEMEE